MKKLEPNALLVIVSTPWEDDLQTRVTDAFADIFPSPISVDEDSIFVDGTTINVVKDEPLEALQEIVSLAQPPFAETEAYAVSAQVCSWRLSVEDATVNDLGPLKKVLVCLAASGALSFFVPATVRIFSPTFVRQSASDPSAHTSAHLFVHAWNAGDAMRTRGLTSVGLPELEIGTEEGMNGAFFNLMDAATACLESETPLTIDRTVLIGPRPYTLSNATDRTDQISPISGHFGVLRLDPA